MDKEMNFDKLKDLIETISIETITEDGKTYEECICCYARDGEAHKEDCDIPRALEFIDSTVDLTKTLFEKYDKMNELCAKFIEEIKGIL